jgi:hypothetical protein
MNNIHEKKKLLLLETRYFSHYNRKYWKCIKLFDLFSNIQKKKCMSFIYIIYDL